ncbi:MAG TPA: rhomboid family intramembrane serine protease [Vicinamibacteria bacterium]|nr:rhomboid family intramembrane serine protease [Vicinamibacteria bacterium]
MPGYAFQRGQVRFGGPLTPGVKIIIIANMVAFLLQVIIRPFTEWFTLQPPLVLPWNFQIWRVGTYMFLHFGVWHLFWNMLSLFLFGGAIESTWGTRSFYRYYFLCGLGGALFAFIPIGPFYNVSIAGASGAVYGILLAYGILFPNNRIYVLLTFPVEAKYLVAFVGFISLVSALSGQEGIAHTVHLGGFLTGYILLRWAGLARRTSSFARADFLGSVREAYRRWRMRRLRRKFEAYYEKRAGRDDQDIIH